MNFNFFFSIRLDNRSFVAMSDGCKVSLGQFTLFLICAMRRANKYSSLLEIIHRLWYTSVFLSVLNNATFAGNCQPQIGTM